MAIPSSPCPPGFRPHVHEHSFDLARGFEETWTVLMTPETFTKGQPWPYRVEFLETPQADGTVARGFDEGTLNAHHGPFLNFSGVVSSVEVGPDRAVRDLEYVYGAYALAFRWIRPRLLRIAVDRTAPDRCRVTVRIESFTRPWIAGAWTLAQRLFWSAFGPSLRRLVPKTASRPSTA